MKKNAGNMVWYIIKLLLVGYIISGIILGVLALMMWKGNPAAGLISGGLLFAYLISCFVGGLLLGKKIGVRKYLWGLLFGLLYFVVIFAVSPLVRNITGNVSDNIVTVMLLCAAGGMLGGMLG